MKSLPGKYYKPNEQEKGHFICEGAVHFVHEDSIYIGENTTLEHGVLIIGPCIIGSRC
jgi:carbonic anhydrase/acetyltransferase-like protein (isoleucine patch superfamily)